MTGSQVAAKSRPSRLGDPDRVDTSVGVRAHLRGRSLGRRVLTGALTWRRADGFEQVHAVVAGGGAAASLLAAAGLAAAGQDADPTDGHSRLVLLL